MSNKKAIIIGAGPAGLTAAYELLKKSDITPIILEASDAIGGISQTIEYKGNHIDIGGHRFFSKSKEVTDLWEEIMPLQGSPSKDDILLNREVSLKENGPDPEKEDNVMLTRNRVSRIFYLKKFFDYPISIKPRTFINMGFIRTVKAGFGYIGASIVKKDETNLENFYINRFGKPLYRMFFEKYTEKLWGRHPSEIDASWGAQRVKGLSLWKTLGNAIAKPFRKKSSKVETSLIESFIYPKKGPGQLYERMADLIKEKGGEIHLNSPVSKINIVDGRVKEVITHDGRVFEGDYFISSMPLKDLIIAIGKENVSEDIYRIGTGLVYRDFITVGLLVDKLKIQNKTKIKTVNNIVPDTWIYVQEPDVNLGRLQIFNNWSPYMVCDYQKYVWIGLEYFTNEGETLWEMDSESFKKMAISEVVKIGIIEGEDNVKDAAHFKIKKAYPGYFDTYSEIDKLKQYLLSICNLYCVGRNGQHRYNNMDHSMLTSIDTVKAIISPDSITKESIWNINAEQEYHEEKKG